MANDITYKHNDTMHMSSVGRSKIFNVEVVGVSVCDPAYYVRRYKCRMYVFEYIYGGRGVVNINGVTCLPKAGDMYILNQGSDHEYYTDKKNKWRKIWFTASGLLIEQLLKAYGMTSVHWVQDVDIKHLFVDMFTAVKNEAPDQHNLTALLLHKIIIESAARLRLDAHKASPEAVAIRNYLDQNILKPIRLDDIARLVHKSPSQAIRIFKREFSVTPYEYIVRERINSAKMLLVNHSYMTVKEVAYMLNFSDEHYFSNVFKNKVGMPPSHYKRLNQLDIQ